MKPRGRPLKPCVALLYLLVASNLFAGVPAKRNIHLSDIPEGLRPSIVSSDRADGNNPFADRRSQHGCINNKRAADQHRCNPAAGSSRRRRASHEAAA